jgi:archaellum biogenesis ATPase FlaH
LGELASRVRTAEVDWLWRERIPLGKLTVLEGDPDIGKSLVTAELAACVSRADRDFPDGAPCEPGFVIMFTTEDDAHDTVAPRLLAAGANLNRVQIVTRGKVMDRLLSLPDDLDAIEGDIIRSLARLVVIDPLSAFLSTRLKANNDQAIRVALTPLSDIAKRNHTAIIVSCAT